MTHITRTFVYARKQKMDPDVGCLASVISYYGGSYSVEQLTAWAFVEGKRIATLNGLRFGANQLGFVAEIKMLEPEDLRKRRLPGIILVKNFSGVTGYVVCYGMHKEQYVVGDPIFGLRQCLPSQVEENWIGGIILDVFPGGEFYDAQRRKREREEEEYGWLRPKWLKKKKEE